MTAPRKATQSATTVAVKVTSLVNAQLLPNRNPATDVVKKAMFLVNAPTKNLARAVVAVDGAVVVEVVAILVAAATPVAAAAVKNVTSAARSVTLHATAPRAGAVDMVVEEATEADTATEEVAPAARHATPAADSVTCLVTVPRARNATTVSSEVIVLFFKLPTNKPLGGEVGHLSRDCPSEASGERVCYKCKQPGHVQASCPN